MADVLRVDPEHLFTSAVRVETHADNVHATHTASDARIDAAVSRWVGVSQAAMTAKAAQWQIATPQLSGRLYDHAVKFHASGRGYQGTERHNTASLALRAVGSVGPQASLI